MKKLNINNNWKFNDSGVESNVNIPHCVKLERLDVSMTYQGKFSYSRNIDDVIVRNIDDRVFIEFEGVMTNAKVFLNDILVTEHFGGYLPIYADITNFLAKVNILKVEVTNYDDPNTPPGKKTDELDFLYYGGIYRDVNIYIKPNIYITNAVEDYITGGGIKLQCYKKGNDYELKASINIANSGKINKDCIAKIEVYDNEMLVSANEQGISVQSQGNRTLTTSIYCKNIIEWEIDNPYQYKIIISVDGYSEDLKYGFRTITVNAEGLLLNGRVVKLFGLNRHDQYPYIGIAASNEAERREVRMLKESGINSLRLAHYPQSSAFLDECDSAGFLVIDCVPGWQFKGGKIWRERLIQCVKEMVRRDRNHASVVMYEVTPNETHWENRRGDNFYKRLKEAAKAELDNCITAGDTVGRRDAESIDFDVPYSGTDKLSKKRKLFANSGKKFLKREYGDWGFGGNNSTSRVAIGDGEYAMTLQAFNFQWDRNHTYANENVIGDLIWEGIDHNRGYYAKKPISKSGIYDVFRRKKFSYYWVKSQSKPIAGDYTIFPSINECVGVKDFLVYSNCRIIALVIDGVEVMRKACDRGETHDFDRSGKIVIEDNYWALGGDHISMSQKNCPLARHAKMCLYQGGDCNELSYPPFTFNNINLNGSKITLIGYDDKNNKVADYNKFAYLPAVKLEILIQDYGIPLQVNNNDFVWLYVTGVDINGQIDYKFNETIRLEIMGGNTIYTTEMNAEAGVASYMLRATSNNISINAMCKSFFCQKKLLELSKYK